MKKSSGKIYLMLSAVILIIPLAFFAPAALATEYSFTTVDVPGCPAFGGVNNSDTIVTWAGVIDAGGNINPINVPGASSTTVWGINDSGAIVGLYSDSGGVHGFLYAGGSFTTFYGLSSNTQPHGINNSGAIVGNYWDSTGTHGFLYAGGSFTTINFPDAHNTWAQAINDSGDIVGVYWNPPDPLHGYLYSRGSFTTIDVPGGPWGFGGGGGVYGINNSSAIVGFYSDATGTSHGFLNEGGSFSTVDVPGASSTTVLGINDSGAIVGNYLDAGGNCHGFVATPLYTRSSST
ncbi:MAG: hypothetical protein ACXU97_01170 [Thermodesulfobacteriota bacterium]